jgi:intracellular sulfur oxidation DsrE/DsrF family protein
MSRTLGIVAGATVALAMLAAAGVDATHTKDYPRKHKIVYHLDEAGAAKAIAVLTNIQNHVDTVGWRNIEALELVVHGPALRTFLAKDLDPEVRGKLDTLMAGGLRIDACQITLRRQRLDARDLVEGLTAVPSGVVRVMELQELGYAYVKP